MRTVQIGLIALLMIFAYEFGDYLGDHMSESKAVLEKADVILGLTGYYIIKSSRYWLGWFFATVVLSALLRDRDGEHNASGRSSTYEHARSQGPDRLQVRARQAGSR